MCEPEEDPLRFVAIKYVDDELVGKSDFGGADPYTEDFVTLTSPACGILFELAAVHGNIFLELIQPSRDDRYAEELEWIFATLGLPYENKGCRDLDVPGVKMPWDEEKSGTPYDVPPWIGLN